MEKTRIQKIISDCGYCSRRKAEELMSAGRVKLNGHPVKPGDKASLRDIITIDGERIYRSKKKNNIYIMLNKPRGYVTTMSDEMGRKCVTELLDDVNERVYPVGRLDKNSEGLLLFTNDGNFANNIMHPAKQISRTGQSSAINNYKRRKKPSDKKNVRGSGTGSSKAQKNKYRTFEAWYA